MLRSEFSYLEAKMTSLFSSPAGGCQLRRFVRMAFLTSTVAALLAASALCNAQDPKQSAASAAEPVQKKVDAHSTTVSSANKPTDLKTSPVASPKSRVALKQEAQYGVASRNESSEEKERAAEDPSAAAREAYENRAYPAPYVPFQATRNARQAWSRIVGLAKSKNGPGAWTLAGPSTAQFPGILTFAGASYTDSGRITALAIVPSCTANQCRLWVAAAGGGIWRTDNALATSGQSALSGPNWTFISGSFATNAIGTITYDSSSNTLYVGTGEPNASADSEAGFGIYKSTDGGDTWTHLAANTSVPAEQVTCSDGNQYTAPAYSGPAFDGRSISSIVLDGSTVYVGSTRGVRGVSSVLTGGAVTLAPGLPPYGFWKSTDGGANFTLLNSQAVCLNTTLPGSAGIVQSSFASTRGVNHIALDPSTSSTVYAAAFPNTTAPPVNTDGGVWRSPDSGVTWTQIKTALDPTQNTDRAEFVVTKLPNGKTRMYVSDGNTGSPAARFYRSDDVATGLPVFMDLTTAQNINVCTGQCWYDNLVVTPDGNPDTVYLGGSYGYSEYGFTSDSRALLYSTDAGASFTDVSWDATTNPTPAGTCCQPNPVAPNGIHPDQHALVVSPSNPGLFFEGSDGGLVRSSGSFADISSQCTTYRHLSGSDLTLCQQLLSRVPTILYSLNRGLSTLQFQSLSVAPDNPTHLQGGTQDNGTWQSSGSSLLWTQVLYGDGGQSGFNASNSALRFNSFTGNAGAVNFRNGDPAKWAVSTGPIVASGEGSQFYQPAIADPNAVSGGTIFRGALSVWRTQDWAGNQTFLETNCPEFTTSSSNALCGDFVQIGPAGQTDLTASAGDYRGTTRSGGNVASIQRTTADIGTLWAATTVGRVFISKNADAAAGSVTYTRLDTLPSATASPGRFISGIYIDSVNPNHAWISYSSYSSLTPSTPGHVFSVTYDPIAGDATWTSLDGSGGTGFPDFPATGIAHDSNGDLYVSNDWGVLRLPNGSTDWEVAGSGLPMVEVCGLTIVPGARKLYAATHGRSGWVLALP
jgi:hypothetical protein